MTTNYYIQELLDSDDEYPDECEESYKTPDYCNDNRFEAIQFKWINNSTKKDDKHLKKVIDRKISYSDGVISSNCDVQRPLVLKGFLKQQDLFCLKSISKHCPPDMFVWFVNYTLYKDRQSPYKFLKSCVLVD